ncbi:dihydrofolate reductase family protein [Hafnia alvei]|uniref:dihydrofolate reductase family protein n=1 Tax=Hafnia alvei TaxID=569 RepID=UPI001035018F|nr:dihydrofolate reductase family protein [Hafnia alvei]TBL83562.1 deaminase [Hafnia alvei]
MKPQITVHMEATVDGRLVTTRYSQPFSGKTTDEVLDIYFRVAEKVGGEATILGRVTLQEFLSLNSFEHRGEAPTQSSENYNAARSDKRIFIVTDPNGKVMYEKNSDYHFITLLNKQVSDRYLAHLRECNVSWIFAGPDGQDMSKAMDVLGSDFGFTHLRLEGGGTINGTFLKAGLLDALSLLIYPGIDGLSGVSSIFEYRGKADELPAAGQALELKSVETLQDGMVWMQYKFHKI